MEKGIRYTREALQGTVLQALLLAANGEPGVWDWGDQSLRRAVEFLERNGGYTSETASSVDGWVPWAIDAVYGTETAREPAGGGRSIGFTDWLTPVIGDQGFRNR
jgi:hypothetical protein